MTALMTRSFVADEVIDSRLLADVGRITCAASVDEVWEVLTHRLGRIGFDRLIYGLTRCRTECSFGDPQDMMILSTHDPAYVERFVGEGMYFHAPMVRWSEANTGACSWGWIAENLGHLTPAERRVVEFNRSMGVIAGYSISFPHATTRERAAMGLTVRRGMSQADADAIWAAHGEQIMALCNIAHLKLMTLPHKAARRPLTDRQREVLQWVGDGKTTADIATIMGLTPATIEKHLRLARETLDVETTAQAVMKASLGNQIFLAG